LNCALRLCCLASAAALFTVGGPAWSQSSGRPSIVLHEKLVSIDVADEDRSITDTTEIFEALTVEGAQRLSAAAISFSSGQQRLELLEAYTAKAGGRRLAVADNQIQKQLGRLGGSNGLTFAELQTWQLTFPDVQPGDRTVLKYRIQQTAAGLPGWHYASWIGADSFEVKHLVYTLRAPRRLPWHVVGEGVKFSHREEGTTDIWEIAGSFSASTDEGGAVNVMTSVPRFVASTYATPEELGNAFGRAMAAKRVLIPEVRAIADEATAGLTRREDVIRASYDWVRKNIRYSAVYLGAGAAWAPRSLADILRTRQGDCKDYVLLLTALLQAKGVSSLPALINLGGEYELLPTGGAQFNHVIVFVPEGGYFLDATSAHTPMGHVPYSEMGKPVVLAREQGSSVSRVPTLSAADNLTESTGDYRVDAAGRLRGTLKLSFAGHAAAVAQARLAQIPSQGNGSLAAGKMLANARMRGKATLQFPPLDRDRDDQEVTVSVDIEDFLASPGSGAISPNPQLPFFGALIRDHIGNYSAARRRFSMACAPVTVRERFTIAFDPAYKFLRVPPAENVGAKTLTYSASYKLDGQVLTGYREYLDSNATMFCTPEQYADRQAPVSRIMRSLNSFLIYEQ
jgi:transglutaminase-like putative cysteine protease